MNDEKSESRAPVGEQGGEGARIERITKQLRAAAGQDVREPGDTRPRHDYNRCHCDQVGRCLLHCATCHCGEAGHHEYAGRDYERGVSMWKWVPDA